MWGDIIDAEGASNNIGSCISEFVAKPGKCAQVCFVWFRAVPSTYGAPAAQDTLRSRSPPQAFVNRNESETFGVVWNAVLLRDFF